MLLHLRGHSEVIGEIDVRNKEDKFRFDVPTGSKQPIIVTIDPATNVIEVFHSITLSERAWHALQLSGFAVHKVVKDLRDDLGKIISPVYGAPRRVLRHIKYSLKQIRVDENLCSALDLFGSLDKKVWKPFRWGKPIVSIHAYSWSPLDDTTASIVQSNLDRGIEPFFALRHLHKARSEWNPRYKWLDATIAAELAIKEFLIRLRPDIETLVLDIPSPPLGKLYGPVLKNLTGKPSPKCKVIAKGAEIRNRLIHRPASKQITSEKANQYVDDVEAAISHLWNVLMSEGAKTGK